jgi:hypothetical protein
MFFCRLVVYLGDAGRGEGDLSRAERQTTRIGRSTVGGDEKINYTGETKRAQIKRRRYQGAIELRPLTARKDDDTTN